MRILMVDDDPVQTRTMSIGLQNGNPDWVIQTADGGLAGQAALEAVSFDVLVTDIDMPDVSGTDLLETAQMLQPDMVRIVVTGTSDTDRVVRIAALAHRVMSKPCRAADLRSAIRRVLELQRRISNDSLKRVMGELGALPVHPRVFQQLTRALEDPTCDAHEIARIIERDSGLTAKTLQVVNSGFFAFNREITSLRHAVALLGTNTLRALVLAAELRHAFMGRLPACQIMDRIQLHSLTVGGLAAQIADTDEACRLAYSAGVMHDIGELVLWAELPSTQQVVTKMASHGTRTPTQAEAEVYGVTHAEIGSHLLGLWGVPEVLTQAVGLHHEPWLEDSERLGLVGALAVAEALVAELESGGKAGAAQALDQPWAERHGVLERLDDWRVLARDNRKLARAA